MTVSRCASLLLAALLGGCAYGRMSIDATRPLEKAIVFVERDQNGVSHAISRPDLSDGSAEQVPRSVSVDINSTIEVKIRKEELLEAAGGAVDPTRGMAVEKVRTELVTALAALERIAELQELTLAACQATAAIPAGEQVGSEDLDRYFGLRRRQAELRKETRDQLLGIWTAGTAEAGVVLAAFQSNDFQSLQKMIQEKVEAFDRAAHAAVARIESDDVSLRIEAFLSFPYGAPNGTPTAVHVEHYDRLPEGRVERIDRYGLRLGEHERAQMLKLAAASREIAAAAERVQRREATVAESFAEVTSRFATNLGILALDLDALRTRFQGRDLDAEGRQIASELQAFWARERALGELPATLRDDLGIAGAAAQELAALVDEVKSLRAEWEERGIRALPEMAPRGLALVRQVDDLSRRLGDSATWRDAAAHAPAPLRDVDAALRPALVARARANEGWRHADTFADEIAQARLLALRIAALFGFVQQTPLPPVQVPEAIVVSLGEVTDTFIDLERANRMIGDVLSVRAMLERGGQELASTTSTLGLTEFDYHSGLEPTVVLTRPSRLAGSTQNWGFAPAVSWLHHYTPRPENVEWYAPSLRLIQPAVGLHAALLDFSSEREIEIGMGATIGFWEGRLQFGSGFNFMADSRDDGQIYFFVGSSLIPLLQSLGFGGERHTGSHP